MALKEKVIGIILIILGGIPFISSIESISTQLANYPYLNPGETIYQIIIIILGILLIIKLKSRTNPSPIQR